MTDHVKASYVHERDKGREFDEDVLVFAYGKDGLSLLASNNLVLDVLTHAQSASTFDAFLSHFSDWIVLAAGVGEVSERGRRGPTSLVARAARQRNAGASRRAADLIRSSTADVALTRTWKPASGHGQELRMRCFNPTS